VIEGRSRLGGRVWTDAALGPPLDLGASWIHGVDGNPLTALADALGLQRVSTDHGHVIRGADGRRIRDRDAPAWLDAVVTQSEWGADPAELGPGAAAADDGYGGPDALFPNGYAEILPALAGDYAVALGRVVTAVDADADGVTLRMASGPAHRAEAAIVTLPLGVLKQDAVRFDPPLPAAKRAAIGRLGFGALDKLYLRFDDVFWDAGKSWIVTPETGRPRGRFNLWLNVFRFTGEPILCTFHGGGAAWALAALEDEALVAQAADALTGAAPR